MAFIHCENYPTCSRLIETKDRPTPGRPRKTCSAACRQACCRRKRQQPSTHIPQLIFFFYD